MAKGLAQWGAMVLEGRTRMARGDIAGAHDILQEAQDQVTDLAASLEHSHYGLTITEHVPEHVRQPRVPGLARQWRGWECWLMNLLDFRYWRCECQYQAPYGRVIMAGCPKHD